MDREREVEWNVGNKIKEEEETEGGGGSRRATKCMHGRA